MDDERQFRDLLDAIPQAVWTARADGTVDYANQTFSAYAGVAIESRHKAISPDAVDPSGEE